MNITPTVKLSELNKVFLNRCLQSQNFQLNNIAQEKATPEMVVSPNPDHLHVPTIKLRKLWDKKAKTE